MSSLGISKYTQTPCVRNSYWQQTDGDALRIVACGVKTSFQEIGGNKLRGAHVFAQASTSINMIRVCSPEPITCVRDIWTQPEENKDDISYINCKRKGEIDHKPECTYTWGGESQTERDLEV